MSQSASLKTNPFLHLSMAIAAMLLVLIAAAPQSGQADTRAIVSQSETAFG
jgi:hypothetical protein